MGAELLVLGGGAGRESRAGQLGGVQRWERWAGRPTCPICPTRPTCPIELSAPDSSDLSDRVPIVQGGDPERPEETIPPPGGGIFAAALRDTLYIGMQKRYRSARSCTSHRMISTMTEGASGQ